MEPHRKRRNWWIWACVARAIVAVGVGVRGAGRRAALGALFEGDSATAQLAAVGQQLRSISDDCASALAGA